MKQRRRHNEDSTPFVFEITTPPPSNKTNKRINEKIDIENNNNNNNNNNNKAGGIKCRPKAQQCLRLCDILNAFLFLVAIFLFVPIMITNDKNKKKVSSIETTKEAPSAMEENNIVNNNNEGTEDLISNHLKSTESGEITVTEDDTSTVKKPNIDEKEYQQRPKLSKDVQSLVASIASAATATAAAPRRPVDCTSAQLNNIQTELNPDRCQGRVPWMRKCSLSYKTACHSATWLHELVNELHDTTTENDAIEAVISGKNLRDSDKKRRSFFVLTLGCRGGFSTLSAMKLFSSNPIFSTKLWSEETGKVFEPCMTLTHNSTTTTMYSNKENVAVDVVVEEEKVQQKPNLDGTAACIDFHPGRISPISSAANKLGFDTLGLSTHLAFMTNTQESDEMKWFPTIINDDNENDVDCTDETVRRSRACQQVPVDTLDRYMNTPGRKGFIIDLISIEENSGNSFNIILGGSMTLARTRYVEFDYDWKGAWVTQKLSHAIDFMDDLAFTCYWAGKDELWRITGCYQEYYDFHTWSFVACVNRNLAPRLADRMEKQFLETISVPTDN